MANNFDDIFDDLWEALPEVVDLMPPLNLDGLDSTMKVYAMMRLIKRALCVKNRKLALMNAFYLGRMIEEDDIVRAIARRKLTIYYFTAAIRTYYIFEECSEQIFRTRNTTLKKIKDLKSYEYGRLIGRI